VLWLNPHQVDEKRNLSIRQNEKVKSISQKGMPMENNHCLAYVGTFAEQSEIIGIAILDVNLDTGELALTGYSEMIEQPTYLAMSADGEHLYATIESARYEGQPGGGAASFLIGHDGGLALQSRRPAYGEFPCHISVDQASTVVFVSNYGTGTSVSYQLASDGSLLPEPRIFTHEGSGPDPLRQTRPHVHCSVFSPDERYLCVCDLGLDKVMLYDFACGKGDMSLVASLSVSPGDGPRHIVFSPLGDRAYVLSEMGCQVFVFSYDRNDGTFLPLQTLSTLPPGVSGNSCSAIRFTPDGRLLMASNRGHDSIAVFRVLPDGQLVAIARNSTLGQTPRDFNVTPNGKFVIVGNQDSNEVRVFSLDAETGAFTFTGYRLEIPKPVCVLFYQPGVDPADEVAAESVD
jgi:6-phosphogluconolactonase